MTGGKYTHEAELAAQLLSPNAYLVCLMDSRVDKFRRLFPHARPAEPCVKAGAAGWLANLSDDQRAAIALKGSNGYRYESFNGLPPDRLDDPKLARLQRIMTIWDETNLSNQWKLRQWFAEQPTLEETGIADWAETFNRYPLIQGLSQREIERAIDHVILYANAVHAAETKEED